MKVTVKGTVTAAKKTDTCFPPFCPVNKNRKIRPAKGF